jgi:hypothetical protein
MPIEKLGVHPDSSVDPKSVTLNSKMQQVICCSECGETNFTLRRVRDAEGRKMKPAKYICVECARRNDESVCKV